MRSRVVLVSVLLALGAITSACSPRGDGSSGGIEGTVWTVESIGGVATLPVAQPTIAFGTDGTVSGTSGCNAFSGTFRTDGDAIEIGQLASTMMGCEPERTAQEAAFNAAISDVTTWRLGEDGRLTLTGGADLVALPAPLDAPAPAP